MNHGGEGVSHHKKGHCGFPVKLNADTDCTVLNRRPFSMNSYMLMYVGERCVIIQKIGHCGIKLLMTALKVGIFSMQT